MRVVLLNQHSPKAAWGLSGRHAGADRARHPHRAAGIAGRFAGIFHPDAAARLGRHQPLFKNGVWMDPDMNKNDLEHATTGHQGDDGARLAAGLSRRLGSLLGGDARSGFDHWSILRACCRASRPDVRAAGSSQLSSACHLRAAECRCRCRQSFRHRGNAHPG
jgi:hypothetical protein